eukprot:772110-Alexandrium_andersonii.AAC.1
MPGRGPKAGRLASGQGWGRLRGRSRKRPDGWSKGWPSVMQALGKAPRRVPVIEQLCEASGSKAVWLPVVSGGLRHRRKRRGEAEQERRRD